VERRARQARKPGAPRRRARPAGRRARTGDAHGQADVGLLERGRVVGAVAGDRHDLALPLQQLHQHVLVARRAARQHLPRARQ